MTETNLTFITFEKINNRFKAFLPMEAMLTSEEDIESLIKEAVELYTNAIFSMSTLINEIQYLRHRHMLVPARKIWLLGDIVFKLIYNLKKLSFQIDGVYEHLTRDLEVKRKWLEKVIIFRRYISDISTIPEKLNWGQFEKGTRKKAENLQKGLLSINE